MIRRAGSTVLVVGGVGGLPATAAAQDEDPGDVDEDGDGEPDPPPNEDEIEVVPPEPEPEPAPDPEPPEGRACTWAVGAFGNITPPSRDWSLLTPNGAWSVAPALSSSCSSVNAESRGRAWIGVDVVPGLRHRYRLIGEAGALWFLADMGLSWSVRPWLDLGPHLVTNVAAWGTGLHVRFLPAPTQKLGIRGVELRVQWMMGDDPDFQAGLLVHVHHRWVGESSEVEHLNHPGSWRPGQTHRAVRLATGFEVGAITGVRLEINAKRPEVVDVGLRAGILTNFFADAAVQPTGLVYVGVPVEDEGVLQLEANLGVSRRDGAWRPAGGAAFQVDPPDSVLKAQLGVLIGGGEAVWASIDGGFAWVW